MVGLNVVCPVCGAREELEACTVEEVTSLLMCAIPPCPTCGWAREEDKGDPGWARLSPVYTAAVDGRHIKQGWLDDLAHGPP
jgi:rubredoxin